jgi:Na+-transporting methylmalonyl-CoA/oxaloacetate decarboxylase beta subunit
MRLVGLFHVLVVAVLFLYVGIRKTDIPLFIFPLLLGLGAVIIPYHIYKASIKKSGWVNYIHIFLVGPLLMYIGYNGVETERKFFELLLMLGFAALGYHGYYILDEMYIEPK